MANPPRCCGPEISGRGCSPLLCNPRTDRCETCSQVCPEGTVCEPAAQRCIDCGSRNQPCCANNRCGGGLACDPANNRCQPCGSEGRLCCAGQQPCGSGLTCDNNSGLCRCGGFQQPCCGGNRCSEGLSCHNGRCECGGEQGARCCPVSAAAPNRGCEQGTVCARAGFMRPELCVVCGAGGQACCEGGYCQSPFPCVPQQTGLTGNVCECGEPGQWCCARSGPSELQCHNGIPCGAEGRCPQAQ